MPNGWSQNLPALLVACATTLHPPYVRLPSPSAEMVHLYNPAQLCWVATIVCSQRSGISCWSIFSFSWGPLRSLRHRNVFCLPHHLVFLHIRHVRFASPRFCCGPHTPRTKQHSLHPRCHISCCVRGYLTCLPILPTSAKCVLVTGSLQECLRGCGVQT